jgi:nanoRNase/pAp phosphatase (c-di-AMP/oligoRNAs hydrolase)
LIEDFELYGYFEIVEKEFKKLVANFNKKRKLVKKNIIFYEIPSKLAIKSSLAGYLVQFCKDEVLVIAQKFGDHIDVSFRRGENVKTDLNKMAKKAVKGIPDSQGGGHEAASGARIPAKYIAKFLKQL